MHLAVLMQTQLWFLEVEADGGSNAGRQRWFWWWTRCKSSNGNGGNDQDKTSGDVFGYGGTGGFLVETTLAEIGVVLMLIKVQPHKVAVLYGGL